MPMPIPNRIPTVMHFLPRPVSRPCSQATLKQLWHLISQPSNTSLQQDVLKSSLLSDLLKTVSVLSESKDLLCGTAEAKEHKETVEIIFICYTL